MPGTLTFRLLGLPFTPGTAEDVLSQAQANPASRARLVVTANVDHVVTLTDDPAFRRAYETAAARTLDGMWLVWFARLRGWKSARRVTGHDLLAAILAAPDIASRRVYLVCATTTVGDVMRARLGGLGVPADAIEVTVPPFGFEKDEAYALDLARRVRAHGTTLLVLGVGAPRSETWVARHAVILGTPLVLSVGEALNVAAGTMPRAPVWMQRAGLEWLFRFLRSPRRLFARYFVRPWRILWILWRLRADTGWTGSPEGKGEPVP